VLINVLKRQTWPGGLDLNCVFCPRSRRTHQECIYLNKPVTLSAVKMQFRISSSRANVHSQQNKTDVSHTASQPNSESGAGNIAPLIRPSFNTILVTTQPSESQTDRAFKRAVYIILCTLLSHCDEHTSHTTTSCIRTIHRPLYTIVTM